MLNVTTLIQTLFSISIAINKFVYLSYNLDSVLMFYIASIWLAFFLAFVLFTKRDKTKADAILAGWLLIIGVHLGMYYLNITLDPYFFPYLMIGFPLPLLHGPMLYFYTSSLTNQHACLRKQCVWHFAPIVLVYGLMIPFFLLPYGEMLLVFENLGKGFWFMILQRFLVYASGVVYVFISLLLLRKHKQVVRDRYSQVEKINLVWLRYLIYGVGIVWLAVFYGNDQIIFSIVALFVILWGYFGIKQVGIFTEALPSHEHDLESHLEIEEKIIASPEKVKARYFKSTLSYEAQQSIHQKLIRDMSDKKLFLNPDLTISELANTLDVHPNHLSQVINTMESKTFYDYINGLRIEEFKKIVGLPESKKYTLLSLAFECGFNSKTAFYRNFKNLTGQSPTSFLNQKQIMIQEN